MNLADLPEIKIVRHARATRLRLRVDQANVRLTVPLRCSQKQIQHFLQQSEQWLREIWQQQKQQQQAHILPDALKLFNLEQPIQIRYQSQKNAWIWNPEQLHLEISDRQPEQYLKNFVLSYAKAHLPTYLKRLSEERKLSFAQCNIRQPKTRWGSCSAKHDIMLHAGLVLFSHEIVRYVCVHELAHTRYFDHSAKFWREVHQHDPNFQQHRHQLKNSALPYWWYCLK